MCSRSGALATHDTIRAVYRQGAFVPIVPGNLPEETPVEVVVQDGPRLVRPAVTDPEGRARIRKEVVARMQRNPIPADAPRFTRDALHERG